MAKTSEELQQMLSDYQALNKAPEVSEDEYNDVLNKVNNLQPLKQQNVNVAPIELNTTLENESSQQANPTIQPTLPQQTTSKQPELSQDEREWQDAIKQRHLEQMLGHFQRAGELMGAGFARVTPNTEGSKQTFDNASQALNDYKALREARDKQFKLNLDKAMNDPKSDISKSAREQARKYGLNLPESTPYAMAEKLMEEARRFKQSEDSTAARKLQYEGLQEQRKQNQLLREDALKERKHQNVEKDIDKHVAALAKSGIPEASSIIQDIEDQLGTSLEKAKDLPGFGRLKGIMPSAMLSDNEVRLRQAVQKLGNITLKSRSGSAVTDSEYKRFKEEFGTGAFQKPEALLGALRQYKKALNKNLQSFEAGVEPEVLDVYKSRPGAMQSPSSDDKKQTQQSVTKDQLTKYAKEHNTSEEQASAFLTSQGYNVEK